jgi:carbonic anhydrase
MNFPFLTKTDKDLSRRRFFRTTVAATAGTLFRLGTHSAAPRPAFQTTLSPEAAVRLAGNMTTPEVIASLEYGAAVLGIRAIMVLGHSNCGAVSATIKGSAVPGQISVIYSHIRSAVDLAGSNIEAVTKANARIQATLLKEASTVIGGLVKENKIKVVAGHYDVTNGKVTLVD